jgi:hypothetical protein
MADPPTGLPFIPLWDAHGAVVGVWRRPDGPEFIEYDIEADDEDEYAPLARTEQGFWASRFDFRYECGVPLEERREADTAAGFRFLERHLAARAAAGDRMRTFEGQEAWLREWVAGIDRESATAERGVAPDRRPPKRKQGRGPSAGGGR